MTVNVVYLDDEEALCEMFKLYLDDDLINVEVFSDENKAIKYCNQENPDIIFIDYRLKTTNGLEVSRAIKTNAIRVLVTGEFNIDVDSCFTKIMEKPFRLAEVKAFILEQK